MKVFKDENGKVLTRDELLLSFLHLEAKKETDCKDIIEYINSCTGKDGTLTEYNVPQNGDVVTLNSLAMQDEDLKNWWDGAPVKVVVVILDGWKCWVEGYEYSIPLDFITVLVSADKIPDWV